MKCNDIAAILDERSETRLSAAERCAVDEHLCSCAECACAWQGHAALLALPIPPPSVDLLKRALAASLAPRPRRATRRIAFGAAILTAGAALAAVTLVTVSERRVEDTAAGRVPAHPAITAPAGETSDAGNTTAALQSALAAGLKMDSLMQ